MSRAKKVVAKILEGRSDANVSFADLCYVLGRAGFSRRQGSGSHVIYHMTSVDEIINIQPKGAKAKPYQVKQVRELILKYQLELD
jgi:predicted RNA binding protein YcfA (HicA-like mRNA interferase family)